MTPVAPTHNLHTLAAYGGVLCVLCTACRRRSLISSNSIKRWQGASSDMTHLYALPLVCKSCACRTTELWLPNNRDEADRWLAEG